MTRSVGETIRQRSAFASREHEAYLSLVRTMADLGERMDRVLRPAGISGPQYNVLRILRGAGPDGLCRNDVRDRMLTRMPDMTRLLDRMEAAGLVKRERSEVDRRHVTTRITQAGLDLLAGLDEAVLEEHRRSLGHLGDEELQTLIDLLARVREKL